MSRSYTFQKITDVILNKHFTAATYQQVTDATQYQHVTTVNLTARYSCYTYQHITDGTELLVIIWDHIGSLIVLLCRVFEYAHLKRLLTDLL